MFRKILLLSFFGAIVFASCRKKDDPLAAINPADTAMGKLQISFQNFAGAQLLVLDNEWYQNENGDSIKVSEYKYYISNIELISDSSTFYEPESYHLINERDDASKYFTIGDIPEGNYTSIRFLIGVDARRNRNGAQTGALDPLNGMFWDWNSGYIMSKMEGTSPSSPQQNHFAYHIVGFAGQYSVLRTVTLSFPKMLLIKKADKPNVHINSDLLEWFKTPNIIKINELPAMSETGEMASKIADNYADMFTIDRID